MPYRFTYLPRRFFIVDCLKCACFCSHLNVVQKADISLFSSITQLVILIFLCRMEEAKRIEDAKRGGDTYSLVWSKIFDFLRKKISRHSSFEVGILVFVWRYASWGDQTVSVPPRQGDSFLPNLLSYPLTSIKFSGSSLYKKSACSPSRCIRTSRLGWFYRS